MKNHAYHMAVMSNHQVEEYLKQGTTVLVPVGTTEQHGPYGPLCTDRMIAEEVCSRVAPELNALIAPPISYGLSITHKGVPGLVYVKIESFVAYIKDIALSLNEAGFRRIIFLNGHYDNGAGVNYALRSVYDQFASGTLAYCMNYWETLKPEDAYSYLGWDAGLHANIGETSIMLAIDPDSVEMEQAVAGWPDPPADLESDKLAAILAAVVPIPGSMLKVTPTGGWGDPSQATAEKGEAYLKVISDSVLRFIRDVEKVYNKMLA
jgi:creatinine amidohydrolase